VAQYWEHVVQLNEYQSQRFVRNMINAMFNTVVDKRIALFGFAFKANTGDTRESPAISVARSLISERARVVITDPQALGNAKVDLEACWQHIESTEDPYAAAQSAHAIAILTEWQAYRELDYAGIYASMEKPAFIFDGRNILDHRRLYSIGFNVYPIGKPPLKHF
jgi:UDPglucose 6-dehydrogenase